MITSKKFRFFDKKKLKYIHQSGFLTLPFDSDEYIVEQYLGKKDINNKEVYEGDIISTPPMEIHALEIGKDGNQFIVFSSGLRGGKDYEDDTFRVENIIII